MVWSDPISTFLSKVTPTTAEWSNMLGCIRDKIESISAAIGIVSTSAPGLCPKLDGNTNHFLRSDGVQAAPPGSGGVGGATGSVDNAIIVADGTVGDTLKGSGITIVTTLGTGDTTVPTSKAVKDVTDTKAAASHNHAGSEITSGTIDGDRLPAISTTKRAGVPAAPSPSGKFLKDDDTWDSPAGGASFWTALSNFTATPASTSTLTMGTDQTATIKAKMPLKYVIGGVTYYGVVSAITSNLLTIKGAPLGGDVTALYLGDSSRVDEIPISIPSLYDYTTSTALKDRLRMPNGILWEKPTAYFVGYAIENGTADGGGTQPIINLMINGAALSTSNTNAGISISGTSVVRTVVDINTSNYDINPGEYIEVKVTAGTNGDAKDLVVTGVYVMP